MIRIPPTNFFRKNTCLKKNIFSNRINCHRFFSVVSNKISGFDAIVLGAYKDGSLSETASKEISEKVQQTIKQQLQYSGVKGKLGEVRVLYGIGSEEGLPSKIAVVGLGTKKDSPENLKDSLDKARVAV